MRAEFPFACFRKRRNAMKNKFKKLIVGLLSLVMAFGTFAFVA